MTINTKIIQGTLEIALEGRLDSISAPELQEELNKNIPCADSLVFDFSKLFYVSSAGLRVLLYTWKVMKGKYGSMVIKNVNEDIMEVFKITGFADILTIE